MDLGINLYVYGVCDNSAQSVWPRSVGNWGWLIDRLITPNT